MNADQPAPTEELAGESTLADAATNGANSGAPARSNGTGNGAPGLQPDPDGNGHHEGAIPGTNEDVFAKAVGLAEAPPKAKRGRRRSNTDTHHVPSAADETVEEINKPLFKAIQWMRTVAEKRKQELLAHDNKYQEDSGPERRQVGRETFYR